MAADSLASLGGYQWIPAILLLVVPVAVFLQRRSGRRAAPMDVDADFMPAWESTPELLPIGVRQFFDLQHLGLDALGFTFVGDCQMHQGPSPVYCRYYSGPRGAVYTELAVAKFDLTRRIGPADMQAITLVTVFDNGIFMQTCDLGGGEREETGPDETKTIYRFRPCLSLQDLLDDHMAAVQAYTMVHGARPVRYPPEQIVEVSMQYASRQCGSGGYGSMRPPSVYEADVTPGYRMPRGRPLAYMPA